MNKDYWDYKNISELLDVYEFKLIVNDDLTLSLIDLQGANLGRIESETFKTFDDVIHRLEIYHYDYIVKDIEETFDVKETDFENWREMYDVLKRYDTWDVNMLGLITS